MHWALRLETMLCENQNSTKQAGSVFNMSLAPLQKGLGEIVGKGRYMMLSGLICFPLLALWFIVAIYLGRKFKKAIAEKSVIC